VIPKKKRTPIERFCDVCVPIKMEASEASRNDADGNSSNTDDCFSEMDNASSTMMEVLNNRMGSASISNRQEYEKRLLTFQASTYYAKPPCLSPLFCARFGWQNADRDMLVCSHCSSAIAITLNSKLSANTFDKLCQAYRNKIVSCHQANCPFRLTSAQQLRSIENESENGNAEEDVRLLTPVYMGQVLPEDSIRLMEHPTPSIILRQNVKKISDAVRSVSFVTNNKRNFPEGSFSPSWKLPRFQIPSKIREMNANRELTKVLGSDDESILTLSLLGWDPIPSVAIDDDSAPVFSFGCPLCLSIMDCELVNDTENDNKGDETDRLNKRQRISCRNLNPLEAHRHYCPYKVGFPTKAGDINAVWKNILDRLRKEKNHAHDVKPFTTVEEMPDDVSVGGLDESIDNVRRILRAGIASKNIGISA